MNRTAQPRIAVITLNTLTGLGMRTILEKIIPFAEVCLFQSYESFAECQPESFAHYFTDARTFAEHAGFFAARNRRTIVLTGPQQPPAAGAMACINAGSSEEQIVREILRLHGRGHAHGHPECPSPAVKSDLTPRECEVLAMIARGLINKQIADSLGIALTTVISHRRNITEKLGIKSAAGLTIYAVTRGYVDPETI